MSEPTFRVPTCPNDEHPGAPVYASIRRHDGGEEHRLVRRDEGWVCLTCGPVTEPRWFPER